MAKWDSVMAAGVGVECIVTEPLAPPELDKVALGVPEPVGPLDIDTRVWEDTEWEALSEGEAEGVETAKAREGEG